MTPAEVKFLNDIAAELKNQPKFLIREEVFFPLRYDKNRSVTVQDIEIAQELMPKDSRLGRGDYLTSIGTTSQNVRRAITNQYKEEMEKDGVNVALLLNGQQGQRGTWREAYNWLWNHKYLRWLDEKGWQILQEKAQQNPQWLQFLTEAEMAGMKRLPTLRVPSSSVQAIPATIPANEPLWMAVNLEYTNYQLLLISRSEDGKYLLCPSFGYAINSLLGDPPILLPQKDSFAAQTEQRFLFEKVGSEEFLAVTLEKPLSLPWLNPSEKEALPELNAERMKELFDQLGKQENWKVFYQSFEVQ